MQQCTPAAYLIQVAADGLPQSDDRDQQDACDPHVGAAPHVFGNRRQPSLDRFTREHTVMRREQRHQPDVGDQVADGEFAGRRHAAQRHEVPPCTNPERNGEERSPDPCPRARHGTH